QGHVSGDGVVDVSTAGRCPHRGPEPGDERLIVRAARAIDASNLFGFIEVGRILGARERRGRWGAKLAIICNGEGDHVRIMREGGWAEPGWCGLPETWLGCQHIGRRGRIPAIRAAPVEDGTGDRLSYSDTLVAPVRWQTVEGLGQRGIEQVLLLRV